MRKLNRYLILSGVIVFSLSCTRETKIVDAQNQNNGADGTVDPGTVTEVDKGISLAPIGDLRTNEDASVSFPLKITTTTVGAITIEVLDTPRYGQVTIDQAKKIVTYTPDQDFNGRDSFQVRVTDGTSASVSRPVQVDVVPVDDRPFCAALTFGAKGTAEVQSQLACQDIDSPSLTYQIHKSPDHGAVTLSGASFFYRLAEGQTQLDQFEVIAVADGQQSDPVTVTIDPNQIGETPIASPVSAVGYEDSGAIRVQLQAEVLNPELGLVFELTSLPSQMDATLNIASGMVSLTAKNEHWNGRDTFKYRVRSGNNWSNEATVSINVNAVNDAPVIEISELVTNDDGFASIDEDTSLKFSFSMFDVENAEMAVRVVTANGPEHGTVTVDQDSQTVEYRPTTNYFGRDSFRLEACEVSATESPQVCSTSIEVKVAVQPINDAPIANNINISVIEDASEAVCVDIRDQVSDVEDNWSKLTVKFDENYKGYLNIGLSLTTEDDSEHPLRLCFLPPANYDQGFAIDNFLRVTDDNGATASADLVVNISAEEDATTFDETSLSCTMNEDSTAVCSVGASDGDGGLSIECAANAEGRCLVFDADKQTLSGWVVIPGKSGQVNGIKTSRGFSVTPPANFNGEVYLQVSASGAGDSSASGELKIRVKDVLDPILWSVAPLVPTKVETNNIALLKFRADSIDAASIRYIDETVTIMDTSCAKRLYQPSEKPVRLPGDFPENPQLAADNDHAVLMITCNRPAEFQYSIAAVGVKKSDSAQTIKSVFTGRVQFRAPAVTAALKTLPTDQDKSGLFGRSIATHGDVAVIGARGAVHVLTRSCDRWKTVDILANPSPTGIDYYDSHFGASVGIFGDYLIVGGYDVAYIYRRSDSGTTWALIQKLSGVADTVFGQSVAISDRFAVVGAPLDRNSDGVKVGAAYVYVLDNSQWREVQRITAPAGVGENDNFGRSVAASPDGRIVIGAPFVDNIKGTAAGAAYVYSNNRMISSSSPIIALWQLEDTLLPDPMRSSGFAWFGYAMAISDNRIIVGAPRDQVSGPYASGSAYIFEQKDSKWIALDILTPSDPFYLDHFGERVALSKDFAVVGAPTLRFGGDPRLGSAYVFKRNESKYRELSRLWAEDGFAGQKFGSSVALSGDDLVLVGGQSYHPLQPESVGKHSGAIYMFAAEQRYAPGDANRDDLVGWSDVAQIQRAGKYSTDPAASPAASWEEGDFTGDGIFNFDDILKLFPNYGHVTGDVNGDGLVDTADVSALAAAGKVCTRAQAVRTDGDFDGNGIVDVHDLLIMKRQFPGGF